jgi:hypothetical protein
MLHAEGICNNLDVKFSSLLVLLFIQFCVVYEKIIEYKWMCLNALSFFQ